MTTTLAPYEDDDLRRAHRRLAIGKVIGIVGVAVLLIGGGMLGTGLFKLFRGLSQTRDRLTVEVPVPGTSETYLETGTYDVVAIGNGLTEQVRSGGDGQTSTRRRSFVQPNVSITTNEGRSVPFINSAANFTFSNTHYDLVSLQRFRVTQAGTYRIEVNGEPGPVQTIGIGPVDHTGGGMLALVGGAVLGLGVLVTIGGVVLYGTGRSRRNRHQARFGGIPGWAPPPAGAPGYETPNPYGQQPATTWTPPPPPPPAPPAPPRGPIS